MRSNKDKNLSTSLDPDYESSTKTLHSSDCYGGMPKKEDVCVLADLSLSVLS